MVKPLDPREVGERIIDASNVHDDTLAIDDRKLVLVPAGVVTIDLVKLTDALFPVPALLADTSPAAIVSGIGNEIHNLACERQDDEDLAERLRDFSIRLWIAASKVEGGSDA